MSANGMAKFESSTIIFTPYKKLIQYAERVELVPELMPDIKSIKILEHKKLNGKQMRRSEWKAGALGVSFHWTQEDVIDFDKKDFHFRAVDGNLKKYEGKWKFKEQEHATTVTICLDIDLGIPIVGAYLNNMLLSRIRHNMEEFLEKIKDRVEDEAK